MINKCFVIIICSLFSSFILSADSDAIKQKMVNDIDVIKNIFDVKYAPAEWKKNFAGWDLETEIKLAKDEILQKASITTREYQKILLSFFNSMQDYHVNINFYSTEISLLPFRMHGAEGHYFVAWAAKNGEVFSEDTHLFEMLSNMKVGDEVIAMGGLPVDEYVENFRSRNMGKVHNGTDKMLSEQFLTFRQASMGHDIEQGTIDIVIKHQGTGETKTYSPQWLYVPELIKNHFSAKETVSIQPKKLMKSGKDLFNKMMITPLAAQLENAKEDIKKFVESDDENEEELDFFILGQHKSFVPPLGNVVWTGSSYCYDAYIFLTPSGRKVGYIRIPTFNALDDRYLEFADFMEHFQKETDALVIDQLNNPGGAVVYLFSLLSMLTNKPLELPPQRMTITQEEVSTALVIQEAPEVFLKELIQGIAGFSISQEELPDVVAYFKSIVEEWNAGNSFTKPLYLYGISSIKPNPKAHYDKPILVLVNYLDFSCADFFPAILQDNQRAKIFGSKTAGAGGFVLAHKYPNLFGIQQFSYTGSIAYRTNSDPIENLGVTPDYPYEITATDLVDGYKSYVNSVNEALEGMLKQ